MTILIVFLILLSGCMRAQTYLASPVVVLPAGGNQSIAPVTTNTGSIGTPTINWQNGYFNNVNVANTVTTVTLAPTLGTAISTQASLVPNVDATLVLGGASFRWLEAWVDIGTFNIGTVVTSWDPAANNTGSLGTNVDYWGNAYINTLTMGGQINSESIIPISNNTYNLGSSSFEYQNGYFNNVNVNSTVTTVTLAPTTGSAITTQASLVPSTDTTFVLGGASFRWLEAWIDIGTFNVGTVVTSWDPASNNTGSLGTSSDYWNAAYITNLNVTSCTGCSGGVTSLNSLTGALSIATGNANGLTVSPSGSTILLTTAQSICSTCTVTFAGVNTTQINLASSGNISLASGSSITGGGTLISGSIVAATQVTSGNGATKTCTVLPTVVGGIVTSC